MLNLLSETTEAWVSAAVTDIDTVLIDHAHCEKKAASTALSLLFRYPQHTALLRPLSELAREELEHFELVLTHLERRGVPFRRLRPSNYAGQLTDAIRPTEPHRLLDVLLCCAIIEARSCERMKCLSERLEDPALAELYRGLLASEARHHMLYVDLASELYEPTAVKDRLHALMVHESEILLSPAASIRMHS